MSHNVIRKGGDRKSLKYAGSKNGSFLTDFFQGVMEKIVIY